MSKPAHRLAAKPRTSDIHVSEDVTFAGLLLSDPVLRGLKSAGFERPSPIQLRAIPLGRCAVDLIVQAKSGTGKTCVLAVLALEALVSAPPAGRCRALVLAPTREVAVQVAQVISAIGVEVPGLAVQTLIGGLPLAQDVANLRRCNIAVGTPGRVRQLVDCEALNTDSVRLFVMDEADKLMEDAFVDDINFIYSTLPASKQMIALSATYPESLANLLARYMRSPTFVRLGRSSAALLGIRQYVLTVDHEPLVTRQLKLKLEALVNILSTVSFTQCLVFSNHQTRAETLCSQLTARGWPSAHLSSSLCQERRLEALSRLTALRCRVLVTTDLGARGVDSEHADLVVQLDVPWDGATYLHRVGRAGRFGSLGAAVALVSQGEEQRRLSTVVEAAGVSPLRLPDTLPADLKTCPTDGWPPFVEPAGKTDREAAQNGRGDEETANSTNGKIARSNGHTSGIAPEEGITAVTTNGHGGTRSTENGDTVGGMTEGTSGAGDPGRKIRVARRRAPGPSSAEQRRDSARLEAAADGWNRAVATRTRRERPADGEKPPVLDWDRPGGDSGRTGSDSGDSLDSFTALLEAYRRDQQRRTVRYESGEEEGCSGEGENKAREAELGDREVEISARDDQRANQGSTEGGHRTENGFGLEKGTSGAAENTVTLGNNTEVVCDVDSDLKCDGGSDDEAGDVDESRLRQVLRKLNPWNISSLTEDDLCTLLSYLKTHHKADCGAYRQAVALVRKKGVHQTLLLASSTAEIDSSLKSVMERIRLGPAVSSACLTSGSAVDTMSGAGGRTRGSNANVEVPPANSVDLVVMKPSETGAKSVDASDDSATVVQGSAADVAVSTSVASINGTARSLRSAGSVDSGAVTYVALSANGAATCSIPATVGATASHDEDVRQIQSREEDVKAFQRDLRLKAIRAKALATSRRKTAQLNAARDQTFPAAATIGSSSSEGSDDDSDPEELTLSSRGVRSGGRQRRPVQTIRAQAKLGTQSTKVKNSEHLPESGAAGNSKANAPRSSGAIPKESLVTSRPTRRSQYHHGWSNQTEPSPWSQQYPGCSGEDRYPIHHLNPSYGSDYSTSAFPSHPFPYSNTSRWFTYGWGGWGHSGHPEQNWGHAGQTVQIGQPHARPGGHSAPPRSWHELLGACFDQQTRYLNYMAQFYAQYHNLQEP